MFGERNPFHMRHISHMCSDGALFVKLALTYVKVFLQCAFNFALCFLNSDVNLGHRNPPRLGRNGVLSVSPE